MKRYLLLLLLLLPGAAFAQNTAYFGFVLNQNGNPVPFANVAVCTQPANVTTTPCSTLATIFSSTAGAAQANPLLTDINGNFKFYAPTGSIVTIQIYSPQLTTPYVYTDVTIGGGGGGSTFPGAPVGSLQCNVAGLFGACNATDTGGVFTINEPLTVVNGASKLNGDVTPKGPNP